MNISRFAMFTLLMSPLGALAQATDWPSRPLRFIVGPGPDLVARLFGEKLTEVLGQQVVVDQRPGGGGVVAVEATVRAAPDGYTLLNTTGSIVIGVGLFAKSPYDLERDLTPAALILTVSNVLVVNPALPVRSVAELVKYARANPGKLNFASGGTGTAGHLTGELLKMLAKVDMTHVPYKSLAQATTDVIGGHAQMMFLTTQTAVSHLAGGRLRALAVSSAARTPALPDLPTMIEAGVAGFEYRSWNGVHLPPRAPREVVMRLNTVFNQIVARADMRERLLSMGMEAASGPPAALGELVKSDLAKWRKVMDAAGIRPE
jgi:tripartite-type tricarboxylate transporter receptor subunit TctC